MKLKKHIKTKLTITVIALVFVGGAMVGQNTQTPTEKAFNYQISLLEKEDKRIYSDSNDTKILPYNYQKQELVRINKFIQKHKFNHTQTVILESMVNRNIDDYGDTWFTTH